MILHFSGMDDHIPLLLTSIVLTISSSFFLTSNSQPPDKYTACSRRYACGHISNINYPFWGGNRPSFCGNANPLFNLTCHANQNTSLQVGSQTFQVLRIDQFTHTVTMLRTPLAYDHCSSHSTLTNTSLASTLFRYKSNVMNLTIFYNCPSNSQRLNGTHSFACRDGGGNKSAFYLEEAELPKFPELKKCGVRVEVPVTQGLGSEGGIDGLNRVVGAGFDVNYTLDDRRCLGCLISGGNCGNTNNSQFSCFCRDGTYALQCSHNNTNHWNRKRKFIVGFVAATVAALFICSTICYFGCKSSIQAGMTKKSDKDIEAFVRNHGPLALRRYKFSEVKKMTNSFEVKLGQGGFGVVYKGELPTGCTVAVKILNASKGNGEEFINEVDSISRTSHVNIVALVGFCLEGHKKALIYEFMPHGSLDKFIYKNAAESPTLSWDVLFQIATGIARGLEYLHRGLSTRILHFDIKPHNILLDENFVPKISDFGLAKLCSTKESIISMSYARGTLGYVAPEVWNRHFGGVSHKSDVYSYGMMLLEMVGGRKNLINEVSHTSEMYFPHWIYNKLEVDSDLGLDRVKNTEENEIARRMTMVGLWCIQTIPNHRPTMSKVIDMLEGNMDFLEMPPKPFMSTPTRSETESSTTLN